MTLLCFAEYVIVSQYRHFAILQYLGFAINSPFVINSICGLTDYPQMEFMTNGKFMAKLRYGEMAIFQFFDKAQKRQ